MELSRRDMLKLGVLGSASLLLPIERVARTKSAAAGRLAASQLPKAFTQDLPIPPVLRPKGSFNGADFYEITMKRGSVDILGNGKLTDVWGYNGITPGPTISLRQGTPAIVRQINGFYDTDGKTPLKHPTLGYQIATSVHLHGSASLPEYDGYASDVTKVGEYKDYHYPNIQDARTLWYHDHGVHQTASNAYMGLAAQYHLHDEVEDKLPIPKGNYDIPLTIRDAIFSTSGQLIYDDNSESSVMGDVILTNGKPWPKLAVEPRKYRFRLLNGSVSRSYRVGLTTSLSRTSDDQPMTVIATDGGLMPAPQTVTSFRFGMAERYEIVIDFSKYKPGTRLYLKNFGLPNNVDFASTKDIMCFDVGETVTDWSNNDVPSVLNPNTEVMYDLDKRLKELGKMDASGRVTKIDHTLELIRTNGSWTVNGTTWVDVVNNQYGAPLCSEAPDGEPEIWEIKNPSGGWFHPFHIHLVDFKIISRNGKAPYAWEKGPKDVVYVGENESVLVALRLAGPKNGNATKCYYTERERLRALYPAANHTGQRTGRYMMHCHNLVHEDHDMMGQFWVRDPKNTSKSGATTSEQDPHHPVLAAPARKWVGGDDANYAGKPNLDHFKGF